MTFSTWLTGIMNNGLKIKFSDIKIEVVWEEIGVVLEESPSLKYHVTVTYVNSYSKRNLNYNLGDLSCGHNSSSKLNSRMESLIILRSIHLHFRFLNWEIEKNIVDEGLIACRCRRPTC